MTDPVKSPLPGIKVLLIGGSGTGKTFSLRTLIDQGITPMCIFTENSFDVLGDVPVDKMHWAYIQPMADTLDSLLMTAKDISLMTYEQLTKKQDLTRATTNKFMPILNMLMNFKCDRTGQTFGNAGTWGTDRALVIDSLSGLSIAATKLVVGEKYTLAPSEYLLIQKSLENLINQCCTNFRCHFICTAHAERELDEVGGGVKVMASTVGKKLAPVLPRFFTDVILAKRVSTKFFWDTADPQADLKARNCPISGELPPSFGPLVQAWRGRGGLIEARG